MHIKDQINRSFSKRIIFKVLTFVLLLFFIALMVLYISSRKTLEQNIEQQVELKAEESSLTLTNILNEVETAVINQAANYSKSRYPADSLSNFLTRIIETNPQIYGSAIAFIPYYYSDDMRFFAPYAYRAEQEIKTTVLGNESYNYFVMDWFQNPKIMNKPLWSSPYYDEGGGDFLMISYSYPLFENRAGTPYFIGVLTADINLNQLSDEIDEVAILETGYAFLITNDGTYVTHPDKTLIMNETIFTRSLQYDPKLRTIGRAMISGERGSNELTNDGVKYRLYYFPIEHLNWSMCIVFCETEIYAPLNKLLITLLIIIVIGLTLTSIIIFYIIRKETAPLKDFTHSALEVAQGNFSTQLPTIATRDEMWDLRDAFSTMQKQLQNHIKQLQVTTTAKERIESELRIAREIQMGMVPKIFPPFPNRDDINLYAVLNPAKEVGGDLYDFFLIDENTLCFAIGDVSGKGVPASLFMAVTRSLLRSIVTHKMSTSIITNKLNDTLSLNNESSMFVTFFLGILDLKSGELEFSNAGHNPPVKLAVDGSVCFYDTALNIPLGIFPDRNYGSRTIKMAQGDGIFLYTDGVTEAENSNKQLYSDTRLLGTLSKVSTVCAQKIIEHIEQDIKKHVSTNTQSDDITMLTLFYTAGHVNKEDCQKTDK